VSVGDGGTDLSLYAADLDSDGDTDLLSVSHSGSQAIAWYENLDGHGGSSGLSRVIRNVVQ